MPPGIEKYHSISPQNKDKIIEFVTDLKDTDLSLATIGNYEKFVIKFARYLGEKSFGKVTAKDIKFFLRQVDYATSSKEMLKMGLIKFYRWYYHAKRGAPHPDCIADIEFIRSKVLERQQEEEELRNGKSKLVSLEEYEKLVNSTSDFEYQAIIEVLNWYGCRISELLSMQIGGISTNDVGVTITILKSKTKPREITLPQSEHYPKYLMEWISKHPLRENTNAPVWINTQRTKNFLKVLRKDTIEHELAVLSNRVLGRHLYPHMFRHTSITRDAGRGLPWTHISTKYGLTKDSRQQRRYDHNKNDEFCEYFRQKPDFVKAPTPEEIQLKYQSELDRMKQEMKELQEKMNKMFEDGAMRVYTEHQQKKIQRETIEVQQQQYEEIERYQRGEL